MASSEEVALVMKDKRVIWMLVGLVVFIVLLVVIPAFAPPPKAHAQRITSVNSIRSVTLILTNTNALPISGSYPVK
jgi:hypothetical protein